MKKITLLLILLWNILYANEQKNEKTGFFKDSKLRLRLKSEYRNREREAASFVKSDAWVWGTLLDWESGYYKDFINLNLSYHRVDKISAHPGKDTSFYLDGHNGFDRGIMPSINLKYNNTKLKIGRFITDYSYGGWDYDLPFILGSSVRTLPEYTEGILLSHSFESNIHLYGMYAKRKLSAFESGKNWSNAYEGVEDIEGNLLEKNSKWNIAGVYDNKQDILFTLSMEHQENVANKISGKIMKKYFLEDDKIFKLDALALYGNTLGKTRDITETLPSTMDGKDVNVYSAMFSHIQGKTTLFASLGYVSNKVSPRSGIDTDVTFVWDQTLDRIHSDMFSYQVGGFYSFNSQLLIGLGIPLTSGYLDNDKNYKVEGIGVNLMAAYTFKDNLFDGFKISTILNKTEEKREQKTGENRNFSSYDIKIVAQYDFNF